MAGENQILGKATIKVDGKTLLNKHGAELDVGGDQNDPEVGPTEVHGFTSTLKAPMLTVSLSKRADVKVKDLMAIKNATITFEGDDGSKFVLSNAFRVNTVVIRETKGEIPMTFSAKRCDPL